MLKVATKRHLSKIRSDGPALNSADDIMEEYNPLSY